MEKMMHNEILTRINSDNSVVCRSLGHGFGPLLYASAPIRKSSDDRRAADRPFRSSLKTLFLA